MMNNQKKQLLTFSKGEIIFSQNSTPSDTLYDIYNGSVELYDHYGTDREVKLTTLEADDFFGEVDMIAGQPRSFTAVAAQKDTCVSAVDKEIFRSYFSTRPAKLFQIMQSLDSRIDSQSRKYINLCRTIYETYKKNPDELNQISLEIQQPEIPAPVLHQKVDIGNDDISIQKLAPGQILFTQGKPGTVMYEIESGEIVLTANIDQDQSTTISTLKKGQCLGVSGIVNIRPRFATATAGPDGAVVKVINGKAFERYFKENEDKIMEIIRYMAFLLRDMNASYARLCRSAEAKELNKLTPPTGLRAILLKVAAVWHNSRV